MNCLPFLKYWTRWPPEPSPCCPQTGEGKAVELIYAATIGSSGLFSVASTLRFGARTSPTLASIDWADWFCLSTEYSGHSYERVVLTYFICLNVLLYFIFRYWVQSLPLISWHIFLYIFVRKKEKNKRRFVHYQIFHNIGFCVGSW